MENLVYLFFMLFFHVVDDFYLQTGMLSNLKQKQWWLKHPDYKPMYKYDYLVGLMVHCFSWVFMIMLPILYKYKFIISFPMLAAYGVNFIIHFIVDDLKANRGKLNLIVDQSVHILQIIITYLVMMLL